MQLIEQGLLALAIGLPAMLVLINFLLAQRLTRLQWQRTTTRTVARQDVPADVRQTLDAPRAELESLGFAYRYSMVSERTLVIPGSPLAYSDVYEHRERLAHALVSPSTVPELRQPCVVQWVTCFGGGPDWMTLNCYRHYMVAPPANWQLFDDYLPGLQQVWHAHLARVRGAKRPIIDDGREMYRRLKHLSDQMIPQLHRSGLLARDGNLWRLRWLPALRLAWQVYWGQVKTGRVVGQHPRANTVAAVAVPPAQSVPAASGLEADVRAFEQHLALRRASTWSKGRKVKTFFVTAGLFLAVGSLWISLTFLPILLAVIALHEGGHYLAMRLSGYANLSVFFLPGLGGLATGEKPTATPWEKLLVYLAGPMPGILIAVTGLVGMFTGSFQPPGWFTEFLIACLIINYLNLLPITPLDGGRVVETFLFARLPVMRFAFAVMGFAALLAIGLASRDTIILVVSLFIALGLPHQWRVMRVDRVIERVGRETLDEPGAIRRIFVALQHPGFARWPFATRISLATTLLPELQGRRAGAAEATAGLAIYLACVIGPLAAAAVALPSMATMGATYLTGSNMVPDDVDSEPGDNRPRAPEIDWEAKLAQAPAWPEAERLKTYLGAANHAVDMDEKERARGHFRSAWQIAQLREPEDLDRARTLVGLAGTAQSEGEAKQLRLQLVAELEGAQNPPTLLLLAETKQHLSWSENSVAQQLAWMRQVLAHREQALPPGDPELRMTRLGVAQLLDANGDAAAAEELLRRNLDALPLPPAADRRVSDLHLRTSRVQAQTELVWFLLAHERLPEARAMAAQALAGVPGKITVSWVHPDRLAREAKLWADLELGDRAQIKASWSAYLESVDRQAKRGRVLQQEIDRMIVAVALDDPGLRKEASEFIAESVKGKPAYITRNVCIMEASDSARGWHEKQRQSRNKAAVAAGLCTVKG
jgi:Zn-dependent protease